jgi:hypothetical protein
LWLRLLKLLPLLLQPRRLLPLERLLFQALPLQRQRLLQHQLAKVSTRPLAKRTLIAVSWRRPKPTQRLEKLTSHTAARLLVLPRKLPTKLKPPLHLALLPSKQLWPRPQLLRPLLLQLWRSHKRGHSGCSVGRKTKRLHHRSDGAAFFYVSVVVINNQFGLAEVGQVNKFMIAMAASCADDVLVAGLAICATAWPLSDR